MGLCWHRNHRGAQGHTGTLASGRLPLSEIGFRLPAAARYVVNGRTAGSQLTPAGGAFIGTTSDLSSATSALLKFAVRPRDEVIARAGGGAIITCPRAKQMFA